MAGRYVGFTSEYVTQLLADLRAVFDSHAADTTAHGSTPLPTSDTIARRGAAGRLGVGAPVDPTDAATKKYVDDSLTKLGTGDSAKADLTYDVIQNADGTWPIPPTGYRRYNWIYTVTGGQTAPSSNDELSFRVR